MMIRLFDETSSSQVGLQLQIHQYSKTVCSVMLLFYFSKFDVGLMQPTWIINHVISFIYIKPSKNKNQEPLIKKPDSQTT